MVAGVDIRDLGVRLGVDDRHHAVAIVGHEQVQAVVAERELVVAGAEKLWSRDIESFEEEYGTRPMEGYGATELSLSRSP